MANGRISSKGKNAVRLGRPTVDINQKKLAAGITMPEKLWQKIEASSTETFSHNDFITLLILKDCDRTNTNRKKLRSYWKDRFDGSRKSKGVSLSLYVWNKLARQMKKRKISVLFEYLECLFYRYESEEGENAYKSPWETNSSQAPEA